MTILIFANGDVDELEWLSPLLDSATAVIAANGGTRHLHQLDHPPEVLIGDLDSLSEAAQEWLEAADVEIHQYPHDKNETDLELALLYAAAHYEEDIHIIGALGGRLDQTLANILLLAHPALADRRVELRTANQRAWLAIETTEVNGRVGDRVSLIPVGGDVLVEQTKGLRWPLENEILSVGPARGVSNVLTRPTAVISIKYGALLCIHTRREWQR